MNNGENMEKKDIQKFKGKYIPRILPVTIIPLTDRQHQIASCQEVAFTPACQAIRCKECLFGEDNLKQYVKWRNNET